MPQFIKKDGQWILSPGELSADKEDEARENFRQAKALYPGLPLRLVEMETTTRVIEE